MAWPARKKTVLKDWLEQDRRSPLHMQGRKVRAPQGKALDNVQRGQPQGKCHREQSARYGG